ncbi:MAG TPA: sialate O-acetylesterase [Clostridiales bacterium]|nr:sialate O-acetylesterase [Clostridiales bacterium]
MRNGAIIEKGPMNWQIIQHKNGIAVLYLSGRWITEKNMIQPRVYAKLFNEFTGEGITQWIECDTFDDGTWKVSLDNIPKGGPYRIETCLYDKADTTIGIEWALRGDMIFHIGVGDLFVIAGQSNAAGYGKEPVYDPPEIGIHIYKNNGKWDVATHPLNDSTDIIYSNMENSNPGHSPFISFAKTLKNELGYPIGLVQASLGATSISRWNPGEDGTLYRNMLEKIQSVGGTVKGILWAQGGTDANRGYSKNYIERFTNMVRCLRKDLNDNLLPIFTMQSGRHVKFQDKNNDRDWAEVREAQRQASKKLDNVYTISSLNSMLSDYVHMNSFSNIMLGERYAKMVLTKLYGKSFLCSAPDISRAKKTDENQVTLYFENVVGKLYVFDLAANELPFTVEDEKGKYSILSYEIFDKDKIILNVDRTLENNSKVHCAFERNPGQFVPIDRESCIPMLAFYGVEIE